MSATENQVGGDHYKKHKIQPLQLAYSLNASPCFCKVVKYLTRAKDDTKQQHLKARHCVQLELDLIRSPRPYDIVHDYVSQIKAFTDQYADGNLFDILISMYEGNYLTCIIYLDQRIDQLDG